MGRFAALILLVFGSLFAAQLWANPLTPYVANYDISRGGDSVGGGEITLQKLDNGQYQMGYVSDVSWLFLSDRRSEQSLFEVEQQQIIPKRYVMERSGSGPDFDAEIRFDQPAQQIHARYKDRAADFPFELPIFDNILYQVQLRMDVASGATQVNYDYIVKTKQRHITYHVIGEEQLTLPSGQYDTIKIARIRKHESPKETFVWLAPSLNYVIVQLQHFEDGDLEAAMTLNTVTFTGSAN